MFNIHAPLRIIVNLTRPDSPCAIPSHMGSAEEDTSVVFGPMSAPLATIMLNPPKFVVIPLDKTDRNIGVVVKSPSVTHVQLAMIEPLHVKHVAVEPAEPSSRGSHPGKKCVERWPDNTKISNRPIHTFISV